MKCIDDPTQLNQLRLPNSVYKQLVVEIITLPFGTLEEANKFWTSQSISLIVAEADDQLDDLLSNHQRLTHLIEYPEYVCNLANNWYLALSITSSEGDGDYLVFQSCLDPRLDQLIADYT